MSTTNTGIPNPPHKGEAISARFMRAITDTLNRQRVIAGENVRIEQGMGGTVIHALKSSRPESPEKSTHPFKIVQSGALSVSIIYGSVNGVGATTADEANDGTVTPTPTLTLASGLNNIYVEATWAAGAEPLSFSSCAVLVGNTPSNSDTSCAFGIGSVLVDTETGAMTINQGVTSSLACARYKCANGATATYYWEGV